ncbi:MAG TPA: hypothetical protein VF843_16960 [Streptosporangiaceae bacterium]
MREYAQPDEAATALTEIRRRQAGLINATAVPFWYWLVAAAAMIAIGVAADTRRGAVLAVVIPCVVAVVAILTAAMIFGVPGRARPRSRDLLGPRGALAIVGYVWLIVALTLGTAFGLRSAGSPAAATIGTVVGGVVLIVSGPMLSRWLRRTMLRNRAGTGR